MSLSHEILRKKYTIDYCLMDIFKKQLNRTPVNTCIKCLSKNIEYVNAIHPRIKFCKDCSHTNGKLGYLRVIRSCKQCYLCIHYVKHYHKLANKKYICEDCYITYYYSKINYNKVIESIKNKNTSYIIIREKNISLNKNIACKVLNLTFNFTYDELRSQFRKLCLLHHPDKNGDSNKFTEIYKCYEFLRKEIII